ncbi:hypothetical protein AALF46_23045, partial [Bacteroides xylanisolvens]
SEKRGKSEDLSLFLFFGSNVFRIITETVGAQSETLGDCVKIRLSLKPWGIALKFLFLHHENILFPN